MPTHARRHRNKVLFSAVVAAGALAALPSPFAHADPLVNVVMLGWNVTQNGPAPSGLGTTPNVFLNPSVSVNAGDTVVYEMLTFLSPVGTTNSNFGGHTINSKVNNVDGIQSLSLDAYELATDQIQGDFRNSIPAAISSSGATVSPAEGLSLFTSPTNWKRLQGGFGGALGNENPSSFPGARASANDLVNIRPVLLPGTFRGIASSQAAAVMGTGFFVVDSVGAGGTSVMNMRYKPSTEGGFGGGFSLNGNADINQLVNAEESGPDPYSGYVGLTMTATPAVSSTWKTDSPGTWSQSTDWTNSSPNGAAMHAILGPAITAPQQITVDAPTTLGFLTFNSANAYTLSGPGPLTISATGGGSVITLAAGSHQIAAPLILTGSTPIGATSSSSTLTLSGAISGSGGISMVGTGTLILAGSNTYTGGTAFNGGILRISNDENLGSPSGGLSSAGGTLQLAASVVTSRPLALKAFSPTIDTNGFDSTFNGSISGSGGLTKAGSGALNLSGTATYAGATTIAGGTIRARGPEALSSASAFIVSASATLDLNSFDQSIRSLDGAGTVSLGSATLTIGASDEEIIYPGSIVGAGGLTKTSGPQLELTGNNSYSGPTKLLAGASIVAHSPANLGDESATNILVFDGGSLFLQGFGTTRNVTLNSGGGTLGVAASEVGAVTGNISGPGGLNKIGDSTLTVTGNNIYSGGTTITDGTLQGNTNSIPGNVSNAGTLVFNQSFNGTYAGAISGSGNLVKSGTADLIAAGTSTYTGATTITQGRLIVLGSIQSTSSINLQGGSLVNNGSIAGMFNVNAGSIAQGSGSYTGSILINSGGKIAPGNSPGAITSGSGTLNSGGAYLFDILDANGLPGVGLDYWHVLNQLAIGSSSASPFLIDPDTLNPSNNPGLASNFNPSQNYHWTLIHADGGITGFASNKFSINSSQFLNSLNGGHFSITETPNDLFLNFTPVPEPTSLALLTASLPLLFRRRSKTKTTGLSPTKRCNEI